MDVGGRMDGILKGLRNSKVFVAMLVTASFLAACSKGGGGSSADLASQKNLSIAAMKAAGPAITGAQVAMANADVALSLSLPDGAAFVSATWDFGDSSGVVSSLSGVTHAFSAKGIYNVSVLLIDSSGGTTTLTHQMNIVGYLDGVTCLADLTLVVSDPATVGVAQTMQVSVPSCLTKYITSVSWDFGDGTTASGTSVQHTYTTTGAETITVQIFAPFTSNGPWVTFTRTIQVVAAPTPTPTPAPTATPVVAATPTPAPTATPVCSLGATRQSFGSDYTQTEACGLNGTKTVTYHDQITETCSVQNEKLAWLQTSTTPVKESEGPCQGQSCTSGSTVVANDGVVTGVVIGQTQVPLTCEFGETAFDTYNQITDQTCQNGQLVSGTSRQGSLVTAGACPTYSWVESSSWSSCSADCGGTQSRVFECRDSNGAIADSARCALAQPTEVQVCDGNPSAAGHSDVAVTSESAGNTKMCPANQIGVTVSKRDVTTTTVYACIDHQIQQASQSVSAGAWVTESYCRTYTAYRCSQDSLSNTDAKGRYQWMLKCQDQIPVVKQFLTEFATVTLNGPPKDDFVAKIDGKSRILYPTFMNNATTPEKVWIAPKVATASCTIPSTAYVAAVCVSSCATPDQEILAQVEEKFKMRKVSFIDALTQNYKKVAILSGGDMGSRKVQAFPVDQWVTEMLDTQHDIRNFTMKSGGKIRLTPNHPVVAADGSIRLAQDFKVGESLVRFGGDLDEIVSIDDVQYFGKVYNLFVKSADPLKNIVVTNGYLNGTAYFQNEGSGDVNRLLLRQKLIQGVFNK